MFGWAANAAGKPAVMPVVTIMDFVDRSAPEDAKAWVAEALSEMITADLVESPDVAVIDRQDLAAHYREMALSRTGLVSAESASRFGRIAAASHVVFGSYTFDRNGGLVVEATVLDPAHVERVKAIRAEGRLADLTRIKNDLTRGVLGALGLGIPSQDDPLLKPATVSLEAAEAYYRGLLAIRNGELETALGCMLTAVRDDPGYVEPQAMLIDLYRALGETEHVRLARERLYRDFPNHRLVFQELYDDAESLRTDGRPAEAVALYERITRATLGIQAAGAWVRLAEMKASGAAEKADCYRKALRIRPDIGLFKETAVKALYELGELKGDLARQMCFAPVEEVRETAYAAVIQSGDREGILALREVYLEDQYVGSNDRSHIAGRLLDSGTVEDWDFLLDATAKGYGTYMNIAKLCALLAARQHERLLDPLPGILASVDPKEQSVIFEGLAAWNHPKVKAAIRQTVEKATDHRALIAGCRVLGFLKDTESVSLLKGLLPHGFYQQQTRTYEVRKAAYEALQALGVAVDKPVLEGEGFAPGTRTGTAAQQGIPPKDFPAVGTLATRQNAEGISWTSSGKGYGYRDALITLDRLVWDGGYTGFVQFSPWVERTNELLKAEMARRLRQPLPILSAAAVDDLFRADSVVAVASFNIEDDVMTALREYVKKGGGLVVLCAFNMVNPEKTDTFCDLMGFPSNCYAHNWYSLRHEAHFTVVTNHCLAKGMPNGVPMPYGSNFYCSLLYEKPLLSPGAHAVVLRTDNPECEAVIVREYGEGRIVILNWNIFMGFASHVGPLTGLEFLLRCLDWAGRVDSKYVTPWRQRPAETLTDRQKAWLAAYEARWSKAWEGLSLQPLDRIDIGSGGLETNPPSRAGTFVVADFLHEKSDRDLASLAHAMPAVLGSLFESASGLAQVERQDLEKILAEHRLSLAQLTDPKTAPEAGRILGARYLVLSTVRSDSNRTLRISSRLQETETTRIAATAEASGPAADVVALFRRVAEGLAAKAVKQDAVARLPTDGRPLANLHYLAGLAHLHRGDPAQAVASLTTACRYAPDHAEARAWLAKAYAQLGYPDHAEAERPRGRTPP